MQFSYKGEADAIRSKLDQAKKNDLRANHFEIGGPTCAFKIPTATIAYRPGTAKQRQEARPFLNAEKANDLRASHWKIGQGSLYTPTLSGQGRGCRNTASVKTMPVTSPQGLTLQHGKRPDTAFVT